MINTLVIIIILAIVVEAITEIVTSSTLVAPLQATWRTWTYPIDRPPSGKIQAVMAFIDQLWNCGYCSSVWVSAVVALFAPSLVSNIFINWVIIVFLLHRLSNWLHVLYELVRRGRVKSFDIQMRITEEQDGTTGQSIGETEATFEP